jgi:hypothetical protein
VSGVSRVGRSRVTSGEASDLSSAGFFNGTPSHFAALSDAEVDVVPGAIAVRAYDVSKRVFGTG